MARYAGWNKLGMVLLILVHIFLELAAIRDDGRVDVLAEKGGETVAIEIETGMSNVVKNVKANLAMKFAKVLIVATDEKAFRKVERDLGKIGLLGIPKVKVVLRGGFVVEGGIDLEIG